MRNLSIAALLTLAALAGCRRDLVCPSDERDCGGRCVAIASDASNCGACGVACAAGEVCGGGHCLCASGGVDCGGACVDLASDPANCGACGAACPAAQVCTATTGGPSACAGACALPSLTACDRACVDLSADARNCGACGRACAVNERCAAGRCAADLYLACFNTAELREATAALEPAGVPLAVPPAPVGLAWLGSDLYVASAASGGAETVWRAQLDPPAVRVDSILQTAVAQPDLEYLAAHDGLLYVAHTSVGTLLVVGPGGAVVDEIPLRAAAADPNPSPQGIAFDGGTAYVALNASNEVVAVNVSAEPACAAGTQAPPCGTVTARIGVQGLATSGAQAMPSRLAVAGGRLFVTLWNLDATFAVPAGSTGRLAVVDLAGNALDPTVASGGVTGLLDLGSGCLDPADVAVNGQTLYVTCGAFDFSGTAPVIRGSGIAPIDLSGAAPKPLPVVAMSSAEAPGKLAFCGGAGYVGDRNSGTVFRFEPATQAISGKTLCPARNGYAFVSDLACGP